MMLDPPFAQEALELSLAVMAQLFSFAALFVLAFWFEPR
jgi:hypothetical protein